MSNEKVNAICKVVMHAITAVTVIAAIQMTGVWAVACTAFVGMIWILAQV